MCYTCFIYIIKPIKFKLNHKIDLTHYINFLQISIEEIFSNSFKIVTSIHKNIKLLIAGNEKKTKRKNKIYMIIVVSNIYSSF
jgi:hypothetical protein